MLTRRELLALSVAFLVTLPVVTARIYASDEVQYFAWLRSIAFDRDVDFENEYRYFHAHAVNTSGFEETFLADDRLNEAGRRLNFAPLGSALLWAPFYGVGHVAARLTGAPADGLSQPYITAVAVGSAVYGFAAVLLSAAFARRLVGRGLLAGIVVGAGTPLVFYTYVAPPFAHATSAFAVSLFLWLWLRARADWAIRDVILLGLAGGLMASVREQDLLFVAGPAVDYAAWALRTRRSPSGTGQQALGTGDRVSGRPTHPGGHGVQPVPNAWSPVPVLLGAAAFLLAFTPQLLAYKALNGHFGPTTYVSRKMSWSSPHAFGVLFDPAYGFVFWTPLVVVALTGLALVALRRLAADRSDAAWIATLALLMFALQVYISGAVDSWTVRGSFGQRRFVATTPLLTLGVAAWMAGVATARARAALAAVLAACVWWNLGLMLLFGTHRMDRQRLMLAENARAVFLELPVEAPRLAWRYLTDRGSFFKQPRQ